MLYALFTMYYSLIISKVKKLFNCSFVRLYINTMHYHYKVKSEE